MNKMNDSIIQHTNQKKMTFYNINCSFTWTKCYCCKITNVLSIICFVSYFELVQQYLWPQECLKIATIENKIQKKCKDDENNSKNKTNRRCAFYLNQFVLVFNCSNTLFTTLNVFAIKVDCRYHIINTNIFKIDKNDESQCLDAKLTGQLNVLLIVIIPMIQVLFDMSIIWFIMCFICLPYDTIISTLTHNVVLKIVAKEEKKYEFDHAYYATLPIATTDNRFEKERHLNGLPVRKREIESKGESESERVNDYFIIVCMWYVKELERRQ